MAFLYPWGNTQQLNLDWILQKIKELEAGSGGAAIDEVANALISATYSRQAYDRSDIVFYDGKLYRANQAIPAPGEVWTPAHWDEILLGDTVSNLVQYVAALSNDQIANSSGVAGTHTSDALNTLNGAINDVENTVAIVSDGNTHPPLTSGDAFYLKNHSSLADGFYFPYTNLAENASITSSNVEFISTRISDIFKSKIYVKTVSGTTQSAGQFNTGIGNAITVLAVKCEGYIGFAQSTSSVWYGFLKNWDLTSPGAISYTAKVYYTRFS